MIVKKVVSVLISFLFFLCSSWSKTEVIVNFTNPSTTRTLHCRFLIEKCRDTVEVFDSRDGKPVNTRLFISPTTDSLTGLFEYKEGNGNWKTVEYRFKADTTGLKRIEIRLHFGTDNVGTGFLDDFTVDEFHKTNSVSVQSGKLTIGTQPVFMLINHSDTTFFGTDPTNHFYGTMKFKTDSGWYDFPRSYCLSTVPEKSLRKADTVFSWVPYYNPEDIYTIQRKGEYKYVVAMGLEKYSDTIPNILFDNRQTRKRTRVFCELETEFTVN